MDRTSQDIWGSVHQPLPRLAGEGVRAAGTPAGCRDAEGIVMVWLSPLTDMRTLAEPAASLPLSSLSLSLSLPQRCRFCCKQSLAVFFVPRALCGPCHSPRPLAPCRLRSPHRTGVKQRRIRHTQLSVQAQNYLGTALGREGSTF